MEERLQKYLAECGVASRRKCEEIILEGKVCVNGKVVTELGTKIIPGKDKIELEGREIVSEKKVYILLNKPVGYVTTVSDEKERPTVMELLDGVKEKVVPVGRLDMFTSGLLLLSNDGEFIYKITHPKHEINKTYTVTLTGIITNEEVEKLRNGVQIDDYITKPAKVKILKTDEEKNISRIEICIHEGKNRQVRKMCEVIGKKVKALHRSKIGNIEVKDIKIGTWRYLTPEEVEYLIK